MDPKRRLELEALRQRRQRERSAQAKRENVHDLVSALANATMRYEVFTEESVIDASFDWLMNRFPIPLAFSGFAAAQSLRDEEIEDLSDAIARLTVSERILEDTTLSICFNYGYYPLVHMPFKALKNKDIATILRDLGNQDWWAFDPQNSWCIELYHEEILTFARA